MSAAIVIVPVMALIVGAAVLGLLVLAYPGQGRTAPGAPWLDEGLRTIAERIGLVERNDADGGPGRPAEVSRGGASQQQTTATGSREQRSVRS
ncbi:hypothetical protein CLV56_0604 [Mumia flava]|uniref:Uncharacterized protein n=1 Tax=Mumia flava TaxID=1348852 RepID=A0A0B2BL68_9ACTN|nr:hypothetical protein [Mumia flava]PJJ56398.1 hypothetical protein CLV56_0604 [Mumia flava]